MERYTNGARYYPTLSKRIANATELPLSTLPAVEAAGDRKEYLVTVYAFDREGNFLSESEPSMDSSTFKLPAGLALRERGALPRPDRPQANDEPGGPKITIPAKTFERLVKETQRLQNDETLLYFNTAEKLIAGGDTTLARALLAKVKKAGAPGRKEALLGYAFAVEGKCTEAKEQFAAAIAHGGRECVIDRYRARCKPAR